MILRLTVKALTKIKSKVFDIEPNTDTTLPLSEWYVNHFKLGRIGYFIITESKSLYSILEPSTGISNIKLFKKRIIEVIRNLELEFNLKMNSINTNEIYICKTSNRSVLGSQTDLIKMAEAMYYYNEEREEDLLKINETPMSYTESYPVKDILKEVKKLGDF
jgi:hypothetical protein